MALLSRFLILSTNGAGQEHCVCTQLYLRAGCYEIAVSPGFGTARACGRASMFLAVIACEAIELGAAYRFQL